MRFDLKAKAAKERTNVSSVIKKYLDDYISGKINYQIPEYQKEDIVIDNQIMVLISEDTRYELREKLAKDRTSIRAIMLYFLTNYLQGKDEKQETLSKLEQVYKDKQLNLF
jgi:hypothetical protein